MGLLGLYVTCKEWADGIENVYLYYFCWYVPPSPGHYLCNPTLQFPFLALMVVHFLTPLVVGPMVSLGENKLDEKEWCSRGIRG